MKNWLKISLIILSIILISIGVFDLFMDSFWCFNHKHQYNSVQKGTNERQQKANYIYFTSNKYNTLLVGSSRTTYMNRHAFKGMNVFNFSATGMRPQEYLTYINFVIQDSRQPIKTIILAVDFFGYLNYGAFMYNNAPSIVQASKSPYYRWKLLFTYDALNNSFRNLRDYLNPQKHSDRYNRDNVKSRFKIPAVGSKKLQLLAVQKDSLEYSRAEYSSKPNPEFNRIMNTIKEAHQDKQFIIYTTPVTNVLFKTMVQTGHYNDYENWLRKLVSIYGTVYHFMYINTIGDNFIDNFADCNHAYPETNAIVARKIITQNKDEPKDFGIILTSENIEIKLQELRFLNGISK